MGYVNPGVRPVYADAIEARIAAGDLDVEPLIERLASRGELLDYPWAQATAARCRGLLLAARGDVDGALAALDEALVHHERSPQPLERGRTLLALGTVQRRAKRRGDARETLRPGARAVRRPRRGALGREGGGRARAHPGPRPRRRAS